MLRKAIIGAALCGVVLTGAWILNKRITSVREDRERHFVSVHFIAMEAVGTSDEEAPDSIKGLMELHTGGGVDSVLLKPFRNGLNYRKTHGGFEIAEPQKEFVSLFWRDRLIASDEDWPHWESSGKKVWKFSGQTIPPNYLNTMMSAKVLSAWVFSWAERNERGTNKAIR